MASNWWISVGNRNMLKGVEGDVQNPIILEDEMILRLVLEYPDARQAFDVIVPTMLPEEQERLYTLKENNKYAFVSPQIEYLERRDIIQRRWNTARVRSCGPRGGGL